MVSISKTAGKELFMSESGVYDINVNDYPRHRDETGDSERIMRAAGDCTGGVLYFPRGVYEIDRPLEITK